MEACKFGRSNVVEKLLAAGAKPDHQDNVRTRLSIYSEAQHVSATSVHGHLSFLIAETHLQAQ